MRFVLVGLAALILCAPAAPSMALSGGSALVAQQAQPSQPSGKIDIDITTQRGGGQWYANPVWIAIGAIALVVIVLLIVMASRGGGTTIVKE